VVNQQNRASDSGFIQFSDLQGDERIYRREGIQSSETARRCLLRLELQRRSPLRAGNLMMHKTPHSAYGMGLSYLFRKRGQASVFCIVWASQFAERIRQSRGKVVGMPTVVVVRRDLSQAAGGGYYGPNGLYELRGAGGAAGSYRKPGTRPAAKTTGMCSHTTDRADVLDERGSFGRAGRRLRPPPKCQAPSVAAAAERFKDSFCLRPLRGTSVGLGPGCA